MCVFIHTQREPAQPAQSARLSKREKKKNLLKNRIIIAANKEKNETKNADVLT